MIPRRINVVGTTGSGKTTLARRLSLQLGIPHVELDALHWGPNWTERPVEEFQAAVAEALSGDTWVVDGNYSKTRDVIWPRADTIVWLDYTLPRMMWQLWSRTLGRWWNAEELWSGNRENMWGHLTSRNSLFLWQLQTYRRRRRQYRELLSRPEHAHLATIHLRSPLQTDRWLASLPAGSPSPSRQ